MQVLAGRLGRVAYFQSHTVSLKVAGIADLAARLTVERRAVEYHDAALVGCQRIHLFAVAQQRSDSTAARKPIVTGKLGAAFERQHIVVIDTKGS